MSGHTEKVEVAVGVVKDGEGNVLIARRPKEKHMGGLWEFPGGKIETGESVQQALARELWEEVSIHPTGFENLIRIEHRYPDKYVALDVQLVTSFTGDAAGNEGQDVQWVNVENLDKYTFPEANKPIITALKLPRRFLITGQFHDFDEFQTRLQSAIDNGITHVQIRAPWLSDTDYLSLCGTVKSLSCGVDIQLFANCSLAIFEQIGFSNLHLNSQNLNSVNSRSELPPHTWLSAACHSLEELATAEKLEVDFVFYSPVRETASHPGHAPVGWSPLTEFCRIAKKPVYALGGMTESDMDRALSCGAQGIAAIGEFWKQ